MAAGFRVQSSGGGRGGGWIPATCNLFLATILLVSGLAGCGYHFVGADPQLPSDIRSIGIGTIDNATRQRGLELDLAFALEREIHLRRHYRMVETRAEADAVINGVIRELSRHPVAFDENDQAVQYELTLRLDLSLKRRPGGDVLWEARDVILRDEYASNPRVVITSSSEFQRGSLDAVHVAREQNDGRPDSEQIAFIQLAESERRRAVQRLLQGAVRNLYNRMVEGF